MPEGKVGSGSKAIGYTKIRDGDGNLLVAFNSGDADDYWGNEYQRERIDYCMRHRRDNIPKHLRTGAKPLISRILGWDVEREAKKLIELNKEESNG